MKYKLGTLYTRSQFIKVFHVGSNGGIRIIKNKRGLVLILDVSSKKRKGQRYYGDYVSDNGQYLHYFGINNKRRPEYYTANKELLRSNEINKDKDFPLYLIIYTSPNHYIYAGKLHYTNEYNVVKKNWLFTLTAKSPSKHNIGYDINHLINNYTNNALDTIFKKSKINKGTESAEHNLLNRINKKIRALDNKYQSSPHKNGYHRKVYEYYRSPHIRKYSKLVAKGHCQLCHKRGPFIDYSTKMPYLESHHITPRHEGGPDNVWNIIALCPDCHRMMHYGFPKGSHKLMSIRKSLHKKAAHFAEENGYNR